MLQVVASPMILITMTLEVSFMLLENIYSTGITHDDRHLPASYFYSIGQWPYGEQWQSKKSLIRLTPGVLWIMVGKLFRLVFTLWHNKLEWYGLSNGSIHLGINYSVLNKMKWNEKWLNTEDFKLVNYLFNVRIIRSKIGQIVTDLWWIFQQLNK